MTRRGSHRFQRGEYVFDDVVGMFETDGNTHEPVADPELGPLRRGQTLVGCCRRMGNEALGVAEIVADANELKCVLKAERRLLAARDLESDERRAAAHLLLRDLGLR